MNAQNSTPNLLGTRIGVLGFVIATLLANIGFILVAGDETPLLWASTATLLLFGWILVNLIRRREVDNSVADLVVYGVVLVVLGIGFYRLGDWLLALTAIAFLGLMLMAIGRHFFGMSRAE